MVQKSYKNIKLEIILDLLRNKKNHIRNVAKNLKTSHTTVLRKIRELLKENVLDYKQEGKNKIFFLRKTLKAKNYIYMAEIYKTNKLLEEYPQMNIILKDVVSKTNMKLIILFGSYAKFSAKEDSDIDIFIETRNKTLKEKMKMINNKINLKIGSFNVKNNLIKEIIKNHVIIKGLEEFYEKVGFPE